MAAPAGQVGLPANALGVVPQQNPHQPLILVTRNSAQGQYRVELRPNQRQLDPSDISISE